MACRDRALPSAGGRAPIGLNKVSLDLMLLHAWSGSITGEVGHLQGILKGELSLVVFRLCERKWR